MKKIIEEIIENTPELEKDKEILGKTVKFLDENNPKILPTQEFKLSLKSKISGLIKLKQNKKTNFLVFTIPVFSLMFVVVGFFYYFDGIDFLGNGKNIDLNNKQNINLKGKQMINQEYNIEDNQVMEIYDALKEETGEPNEIFPDNPSNMGASKKMTGGSELLRLMDNTQEVDNIGAGDMMENSLNNGLVDKTIELNFKDFCEQKHGKLSGTGTSEKCIVDKKECLASQFKNGICDFVEIK